MNDMNSIRIVKMLTPPMNSGANWGEIEIVKDPQEIINYLKDPQSFTDDEIFYDDLVNPYTISDLIGKTVIVGDEIFQVIE